MALSLEQLKQAFKKPEQSEGGNRPNNYYPFWNIAEGQQAIVRFLPDKNQDNPFGFVVEKLMHTLTTNGDEKSVPCLKMYGEDCPVCKVSSEYYKKDDETNGKKYWRKKQHIAQALVIEDPLKPNETTKETHEGKVRFLAIGWQLFQVIQESFGSGDLEAVPYNMDEGYDFVIKKTKNGNYFTYAVGSRFKAKARPLTDEEKQIAEDHMIDLSTLLPKNPGEERVAAMLTSALTGASYTDSSSKKGSATADADDDSEVVSGLGTGKSTPEVETSTGDAEDDGEEILAMIRNRRQSKV